MLLTAFLVPVGTPQRHPPRTPMLTAGMNLLPPTLYFASTYVTGSVTSAQFYIGRHTLVRDVFFD
jgi:hypothetical protein